MNWNNHETEGATWNQQISWNVSHMKCTGTELKALSFVDVHTYAGNCKILIYKKYHKEGILFLSKPYFPAAREKKIS